MKTTFTPEQLQNPETQRSNKILRACVHCGFCTATCPSYQVLNDELDSPRGRIYLIKDMLENDRKPDKKTVTHIDRCLSCFACMTTCPSGVNYMHLLDHARGYIDRHYRRGLADRGLRWLLARVLPYPGRFRWALRGARLIKPIRAVLPVRVRAMVALAPVRLPPPCPDDAPQVFPAIGKRIMRVALMTGCAQKVLDTDINAATLRILRRAGCEVVIAKGAGCCGALVHHLGRLSDSHRAAAANITAWKAEINGAGLDAIVINTSGCGTMIKDYGHIFANTDLAGDAADIAGLARDITEVLAGLPLMKSVLSDMPKVAYHAACSLQHGQQIKDAPKDLLRTVGFEVVEPVDAHLCCGSAGTYNLLQPDIAGVLKTRKVAALNRLDAEVIATGNIGCMMQIGADAGLPVVHTVELLDWATGGEKPF